MGTGVTIECSSCDYSLDLYLGLGFAFAQEYENLVSNHLQGEERECVRAAVGDNVVTECAFERAVFTCPSCLSIEAALHYHVVWDGGEIVAQHSCKKCKGPLTEVETFGLTSDWLDELECLCPSCSAPLRREAGFFMWD